MPLSSAMLDEIIAAIAQYDTDGEVITCWQRMLATISREKDLMWVMEYRADLVGVHENNRGGLGLVLDEAFASHEAHIRAGYSYALACSDAYAVQPPSDPDKIQQALAFNRQNIEQQDMMIPYLTDMLIQTISAGHNNASLRAMIGKVKSSNKFLAPTGAIDPDQLCQGRPDLLRAYTKGLTWTVFHRDIPANIPRFVDIAQASFNTKPSSEVSEIEVFFTMEHSRSRDIQAGRPIDWDRCQRESVRTQPPCAAYIHNMLAYFKTLSTEQIQYIGVVKRVFGNKPIGNAAALRVAPFLGGEFYNKVASMSWPWSLRQYPRMRLAPVVANMLSPHTKIAGGKYSIIKESMLAKLCNKKDSDRLEFAENMIDHGHVLCDRMLGVNTLASVKVSCLLTARVIYHILKLGAASSEARDYPDMLAIGEVFCQELADASGAEISNPWPRTVATDANDAQLNSAALSNDAPASSVPHPTLLHPEAPASIADMKSMRYNAVKRGFAIGAKVFDPKAEDKYVYMIMAMTETNANVESVSVSLAPKSFDLPLELFCNHWKLYRGTVQSLQPWRMFRPSASTSWNLDIVKGMVSFALNTLSNKYDAEQASLEVLSNPKDVRALEDIACDGLHIEPATRAIVLRRASETVTNPEKSVDIGVILSPPEVAEDTHVMLYSMFSIPKPDAEQVGWVNPYWLVEVVDADSGDTPNMHKEIEAVTITIPGESISRTLSFPILKPTMVIKKGELLRLPIPAEKQVPRKLSKKQKVV